MSENKIKFNTDIIKKDITPYSITPIPCGKTSIILNIENIIDNHKPCYHVSLDQMKKEVFKK